MIQDGQEHMVHSLCMYFVNTQVTCVIMYAMYIVAYKFVENYQILSFEFLIKKKFEAE